MRINATSLKRLEKKGASVAKKPEPPKPPEPKPMTQAEMAGCIAEALAKNKDKTTSFRF